MDGRKVDEVNMRGQHKYISLEDLKILTTQDLLNFLSLQKWLEWGSLGGAVVWCLPLAQGAILETRDRIPRQAPCMEPASPSACVSASLSLSLSLCDYHKLIKIKKLNIKMAGAGSPGGAVV